GLPGPPGGLRPGHTTGDRRGKKGHQETQTVGAGEIEHLKQRQDAVLGRGEGAPGEGEEALRMRPFEEHPAGRQEGRRPRRVGAGGQGAQERAGGGGKQAPVDAGEDVAGGREGGEPGGYEEQGEAAEGNPGKSPAARRALPQESPEERRRSEPGQ